MNMVENLGKEAMDVVPSEKVAAPTPSLFLDASVYRYVHWEYFSSRISWIFFLVYYVRRKVFWEFSEVKVDFRFRD